MENNNFEMHKLWANIIGLISVIFLIIILNRGCNEVAIKRIELQKFKATSIDSIGK